MAMRRGPGWIVLGCGWLTSACLGPIVGMVTDTDGGTGTTTDGPGASAEATTVDGGDTTAASGASSDASSGEPPPSLPPPWWPGARLTPWVYSAGGGAEVLAYFEDTDLDIACSFVEVEDGWRCLPIHRVGSRVNPPLYADEACTIPLARAGGPCGEPAPQRGDRVVAELPTPALDCRTTLSPFTVAEVYEGPVFRYADGPCVPWGDTAGVEHHVLEPMPLTEFAAANPINADPGDDVALVHLEAEDGAGQRLALADLQGRRCEPWLATHAEACVPQRALHAPSTTYSDLGCTQADVVVADPDPRCVGAPTFAFRSSLGASEDPLDPDVTIFALGPPYMGPLYHDTNPIPCLPWPVTDPVYTLGEQVPVDRFPAITHHPIGTDTVTARWFGGASTEPLVPDPAPWFDQDRAAPCEARRTVDGALRCLPTDALPLASHLDGNRYADPMCTIHLSGFVTHPAVTDFSGYVFVDSEGLVTCSGDVVATHEAVHYEGSVYVMDGMGACIYWADTFAGYPQFTQGDAIPLTSWPTIEVVPG